MFHDFGYFPDYRYKDRRAADDLLSELEEHELQFFTYKYLN